MDFRVTPNLSVVHRGPPPTCTMRLLAGFSITLATAQNTTNTFKLSEGCTTLRNSPDARNAVKKVTYKVRL